MIKTSFQEDSFQRKAFQIEKLFDITAKYWSHMRAVYEQMPHGIRIYKKSRPVHREY
jgi:hypothetical protein